MTGLARSSAAGLTASGKKGATGSESPTGPISLVVLLTRRAAVKVVVWEGGASLEGFEGAEASRRRSRRRLCAPSIRAAVLLRSRRTGCSGPRRRAPA